MLEELKQAPQSLFVGQVIFLASVVVFIISIVIDIIKTTTTLANYTIFGVLAACILGIITGFMAKDSGLKFIVIDLVVTAFIFIAYAEVFAV